MADLVTLVWHMNLIIDRLIRKGVVCLKALRQFIILKELSVDINIIKWIMSSGLRRVRAANEISWRRSDLAGGGTGQDIGS